MIYTELFWRGCCLSGTSFSFDENKNVSSQKKDTVNFEMTHMETFLHFIAGQSLSPVFRYFDQNEVS